MKDWPAHTFLVYVLRGPHMYASPTPCSHKAFITAAASTELDCFFMMCKCQAEEFSVLRVFLRYLAGGVDVIHR